MENNYDIQIFNLNNYVLPDYVVSLGTKYILNGDNNSFFDYVYARYKGSPTNAGIINSYVKFIIGDGLVNTTGVNINKYISEEDLELICADFKMYGQYSLQVIWSQGSKLLKEAPKPIQVKFIPTNKLGLSQNTLGEIDGYWYSFDWNNRTRYKPQFFPKFDGMYKDNAIEVITFNRVSSEPYFPHPDYLSGLQYAQIEEELSNMSINHIFNGFSGGTLINCKGGVPPTEEERDRISNAIKSKLTGSNNKNKLIVSFSNGLDAGQDIDVTNLETPSLDINYIPFSEEAQKKLFIAHSVVSPILFGIRDGSGLGSNKDEMKEALKLLYRSNINPMRKVILRGLTSILKFAEPDLQLEFVDFEELRVDTIVEEPKNNEIQ